MLRTRAKFVGVWERLRYFLEQFEMPVGFFAFVDLSVLLEVDILDAVEGRHRLLEVLSITLRYYRGALQEIQYLPLLFDRTLVHVFLLLEFALSLREEAFGFQAHGDWSLAGPAAW